MAMIPNSTLQSCSTALDRCILELKVQLDALIERREYTSVEKVAGVIASVGQCRDQLGQSSDDIGKKSAGVLTEVGRPLSAKLSKSHEQVSLGPRVIAQSTKASFMCSEHELIKVGRTKEGGEYRHRVLWSQVVRALRQFAQIDSREWRVSQVCEYSNQDQHNAPLTETHVYLTLGLLNAQSPQIIGAGSQRGHYTVLNPVFLRDMADLIEKSSSAEEIENWLAADRANLSKGVC